MQIPHLPDVAVFQSFSHVWFFAQPQGLQQASLLRPPLSLRVCSNSRPLSRWCYLTISSSVVPFSPCLQSFPASRSFPVSQLFTSGGQSIGASVSASVLPINIQGWFPLQLTDSYGLVQRFSASALLTLAVDSCGSLPCGMDGSIPGLYSPDASSTPQVVTTTNVFRHFHLSLGEGSKNCSWLKPAILIQ